MPATNTPLHQRIMHVFRRMIGHSNRSLETPVKFTVYNLRTYFSRQPGDIKCCPACGSSLSRSHIHPSRWVSDQLSIPGYIPRHEFSHLYECTACQWWAVRESWTLCEIGMELDYLVVGEAKGTKSAAEETDSWTSPWIQVLENENLYRSSMSLPDILGQLFAGGEKKIADIPHQ